jgi:hypothetical protein
VRLLPVASFVAISSILGAKIAVRIGTKLVVAIGLFSMAAFYVWGFDLFGHHRLRDDRCPDGGARDRDGPHQRAATEAIMDKGPRGEGRRRLGGK